MSRLGDKLKELRDTQSLYEVEQSTGIRRNEIRRYELGEYAPSTTTLEKLAEYFEVTYDELRKLYYDDFFEDPRERRIAIEWAKEATP